MLDNKTVAYTGEEMGTTVIKAHRNRKITKFIFKDVKVVHGNLSLKIPDGFRFKNVTLRVEFPELEVVHGEVYCYIDSRWGLQPDGAEYTIEFIAPKLAECESMCLSTGLCGDKNFKEGAGKYKIVAKVGNIKKLIALIITGSVDVCLDELEHVDRYVRLNNTDVTVPKLEGHSAMMFDLRQPSHKFSSPAKSLKHVGELCLGEWRGTEIINFVDDRFDGNGQTFTNTNIERLQIGARFENLETVEILRTSIPVDIENVTEIGKVMEAFGSIHAPKLDKIGDISLDGDVPFVLAGYFKDHTTPNTVIASLKSEVFVLDGVKHLFYDGYPVDWIRPSKDAFVNTLKLKHGMEVLLKLIERFRQEIGCKDSTLINNDKPTMGVMK